MPGRRGSGRPQRWGQRPDLFSPPELPESWWQVAAPVPAAGPDSPAGRDYAAKWRAIVNAAAAVGWGPLDVAAYGIRGLERERRRAGLRPWADRTLVHYSKLVAYAGLAVDAEANPAPRPLVTASVATTLHDAPDARDPSALRTAAVAAAAWALPTPPQLWLALDRAALVAGSAGWSLTVTDEVAERTGVTAGTYRMPDGGARWQRWLDARSRVRDERTGPLLCTTRASPTSPPGAALSLRGFQAAWARHARACGAAGLDYTAYRLAAAHARRPDANSSDRPRPGRA